MTDTNNDTQDKVEDAESQTQTVDDLFESQPVKEVAKVEKVESKSEVDTEEEDETAETTTAEEKSVPIKALTEERRKRQEAEKKAEELEARLSKAADPEVEQVPDPIEDPKGYAKFIEDKNNFAAVQINVNLSRDLMIEAKSDYEEKEKVFVELTKENPTLVQKMMASPNPAKFAYQTAEKHLENQKYQDPKYRESLEAKWKEEYLATLKAEDKKPGKKSALEVPNLIQASAAGTNSEKAVQASDLDDVTKDSPLDKRSYG